MTSDRTRSGPAARRAASTISQSTSGHSVARPREVALLEQRCRPRGPSGRCRRRPGPRGAIAASRSARRPVAVAVAERGRELQQQLPVRAHGGPGQEGALEPLDASLHVRERAFLLGERSGRQDDVGRVASERSTCGRRPRGSAPARSCGDLRGVVGDRGEVRRRRRGSTSGEALPESTASRPYPPLPGVTPMSRAPRKFGAASSAVDPLRLRLDLAGARLRRRATSRFGAGEVVGDLPKEEVLLVREVRRAREEEAGRPGRLDRPADLARPSARRPTGTIVSWTRAALAQRRLVDVAGVQALGEEAPVVAEPVVVDLGIEARQEAVDDVVLATRSRCCSRRCSRGRPTASCSRYQTRLRKRNSRRRQGADGADVRGAARPVVVERLSLVRPDERAAAAVEERQLARLGDLLREADAARALDAAGHVGDDVRADHRPVVGRVLALLLVVVARAGWPVAEGVVLQRALAGLVADRAVERVVDEEELHRRAAGVLDLRRSSS